MILDRKNGKSEKKRCVGTLVCQWGSALVSWSVGVLVGMWRIRDSLICKICVISGKKSGCERLNCRQLNRYVECSDNEFSGNSKSNKEFFREQLTCEHLSQLDA